MAPPNSSRFCNWVEGRVILGVSRFLVAVVCDLVGSGSDLYEQHEQS